MSGITDGSTGEGYSNIIKYFLPEFVTATIFLFCSSVIDGYFIGQLQSTSLLATQGVTSTLLHFIIKVAEGLLVGTVVMCGQYNGIQDYKTVGKSLANAFWLTVIFGGIVASFLYFGAYWIYAWYGVPQKMIYLGIPLLRLKALGIFLMCIVFAFIGFLRGVKNTRVPMLIFILGGIVFVIFDYILVFGKFGFPALELRGSAIASIVQYSFMLVAALLYVLLDSENQKYCISLFTKLSLPVIKDLLFVSWPVMVDISYSCNGSDLAWENDFTYG